MTQAARQDELQLVQACAAGDRAALARFESHYLVLVDLVAHRMGAPPSLAAEAKQILRCRLLVRDGGPPGISTFRGTGPLAGWLAIAASRLIWKLLQRTRRGFDESAAIEEIVSSEDPELEHGRAVSTQHFRVAFRSALAALPEEDRQVLRSSALEGRTIDDLAAVHGVHRSTISRRLERIRRALCDETRRALAEELLLEASEVQTIVLEALPDAHPDW